MQFLRLVIMALVEGVALLWFFASIIPVTLLMIAIFPEMDKRQRYGKAITLFPLRLALRLSEVRERS